MRQRSCPAPLDGPEEPTDYLTDFGFERPKYSSRRYTIGLPVLALFALPCLIAAVWIFFDSETTNVRGLISTLLSPVVTFGLLLGGYWQWRKARFEISMDKYYERLNISNQWWKSSSAVQKVMSGFSRDSEDPDVTMYVCLEIDNLEYVIEKYRIGYIDDEQACRGLRAFQIRCLTAPEFREIARRRIRAGDYTPRTATVVRKVCDAVETMAEHQRASLLVSFPAPQAATATTTIHPANGSPLHSPSPNGARPGPVASESGSPKEPPASSSAPATKPSPEPDLQQRATGHSQLASALQGTPGSRQGDGDHLREKESGSPADSPPPHQLLPGGEKV